MREFLLAAAASFALFGGPAMAGQGGHRVVAGYGHVLHADAGGGDGTGAGNRLAEGGGGGNGGTGAGGNRLAEGGGGGNGGSWVAQQAQA
jgi:hypothetical protein